MVRSLVGKYFHSGPSGGTLPLGGLEHTNTQWCADQHGGKGRDEGAKVKCNVLLTGNSKK